MNNVLNQPCSHGSTTQMALESPLVLIVENHEDSRLMLKIMLELNDVNVVEANNGETAIKVAVQEKPDLILMDLSLPGLDGITAMQHIRQFDALKQVPVVFITGYIGDRYRDAILTAGGNDFLVKPISYKHFFRLLKRHLYKKRTQPIKVITT